MINPILPEFFFSSFFFREIALYRLFCLLTHSRDSQRNFLMIPFKIKIKISGKRAIYGTLYALTGLFDALYRLKISLIFVCQKKMVRNSNYKVFI